MLTRSAASLLLLAVGVVWLFGGAGTATADSDLERSYSTGVWSGFQGDPDYVGAIWKLSETLYEGVIVIDSVGSDWVAGDHVFSFTTGTFTGGTYCARIQLMTVTLTTGYSDFQEQTICGDGGSGWMTFTFDLTDMGAPGGEPYWIAFLRQGTHGDDTLSGDFSFYGGQFSYRSDLESEFIELDPGMEGKLTEVQGAELLDGLESLVYFAGIGIAVVVASLLAALLGFFRR